MSKLPPFPKPRWYESMRRWDLHLLAYRKGVEAEGDRIIKLLETECERPLDPKWEHYREQCSCHQILLIKGETE